jgi:hypothetical protein
VRGVAPGRVDLPRTRRTGFSAALGFVLVIGLLLVGGSLAVSGGGGLLSVGGRLWPSATPTPAPATVSQVEAGASAVPVDEEEDVDIPPAKTANMKTYSCENGAIKDLSRGNWFLSDVQAAVQSDEDGNIYDQLYWRMDRQNPNKKVKADQATEVSMVWTTPDKAKERFGDLIGRVQGDRALIITFDGPMTLSVDSSIERSDLDGQDIDQIRRVDLFEYNDKVRTVIGIKGESCARLGSIQWGAKSKKDNARVVLDIERF